MSVIYFLGVFANMSHRYIIDRETVNLSAQKYRQKVLAITNYINSIPLVLPSEKHCVIEVLLPRLRTELLAFLNVQDNYLCYNISIQMCEEIIVEMCKCDIDVWLFAANLIAKIDAYVQNENLQNIVDKPHEYFDVWLTLIQSVLPSDRCTKYCGAYW